MPSPTSKPNPPTQSQIAQQEATDSPRRLAVTVKVQEPQDLKVVEGSQVKKGQVIAARYKDLPNLEPIILEHEQAKLKQLKLKHTAAVRDYQLAVGKLQSAKNQRAYQKYQASLEAARRVEEVNQARSSYERQLAE